jgi:hypothetical protein
LRVRFLRTACPACWLLDVSRLIASRMVFRAQGESPAPRSWKRRATCSRRVVRRVCSELIMWYRKLTILDRISKRHSRPLDFPLAPLARLELPSRAPRTSLSRASRLPSRAPRDSSGTFKSRLEKRVGARGARLAHPTGTRAFGEAPSPGPTRRREAPSAPPTRRPRHYRARATSCGVPSYKNRRKNQKKSVAKFGSSRLCLTIHAMRPAPAELEVA